MPNEQHVKYTDERWSVDLIIRPARMVDAARRMMWQNDALHARGKGDAARDYVRIIQHPDLCAAIDADKSSLTLDGIVIDLPITGEVFEQFPEMPPALLGAWFEAVYAANPHWSDKPTEAEKKA